MTGLFDAWPAVEAQLKRAERLLLMLDFDGTLAPITARPPEARMPPETARALHALADAPGVTLAIISGRGAAEVRALAGLPGIRYFGSHGRERILPGRAEVEADGRWRSAVREACRALDRELGDVEGFVVEDKGLAAAAHFRNADPRDHARIARTVLRIVGDEGPLRASRGKMVFDITPPDGIDKGAVAAELLEECGGLAMYFGDDTTDESVFRALPPPAVTVFVGPTEAASAARFQVAEPAEVGAALEAVLEAWIRPTAGR